MTTEPGYRCRHDKCTSKKQIFSYKTNRCRHEVTKKHDLCNENCKMCITGMRDEIVCGCGYRTRQQHSLKVHQKKCTNDTWTVIQRQVKLEMFYGTDTDSEYEIDIRSLEESYL